MVLYLFHPMDNQYIGQFPTQQTCIKHINKMTEPELTPEVIQCIYIKKSDLNEFYKED